MPKSIKARRPLASVREIRTSFRPTLHGWAFPNTFSISGVQLGLGAPLAPGFGLSGGMCWSALDRWLARRRMGAVVETPEANDALHAEMLRRQANALAARGWSDVLGWRRALEATGVRERAALAKRQRREWDVLRRSLEDGVPMLIWLIHPDSLANPSTSRQVLAYRAAANRADGELTLWVYDPDRPRDDDVRIVLALPRRGPSLRGSGGGPRGPAAMRGATDPLTFAAIAYDRPRPPLVQVRSLSEEPSVGRGSPIAGAPVAVMGSDGSLHAFASDASSKLVHFEHRPGRGWTGENVSEQKRVGGRKGVVGAPLPFLTGRSRWSVLARNEAGDLIEFRRAGMLGWSSRNLTGSRRIGPRFRIEGEPVSLSAGGSVDVFGRSGGSLIHYGRRSRGWKARDLTERLGLGERYRISSQPAAVLGPGGSRHVFAVNGDGELIHYYRRGRGGWAAENVTARQQFPDRLRLGSGGLAALCPDGRSLAVFGLQDDGELTEFRWSPISNWTATNVVEKSGGEALHRLAEVPVAVAGSGGGVHLLARGRDCGLLHFSRPSLNGAWRADALPDARETLPPELRPDGAPCAVAGPGNQLWVFARAGKDLLLYRWTPEADWEAESLTRERWPEDSRYSLATDPVAIPAGGGGAHLLACDAQGTLVHAAITSRGRGSTAFAEERGMARARAQALALLAAPAELARAAAGAVVGAITVGIAAVVDAAGSLAGSIGTAFGAGGAAVRASGAGVAALVGGATDTAAGALRTTAERSRSLAGTVAEQGSALAAEAGGSLSRQATTVAGAIRSRVEEVREEASEFAERRREQREAATRAAEERAAREAAEREAARKAAEREAARKAAERDAAMKAAAQEAEREAERQRVAAEKAAAEKAAAEKAAVEKAAAEKAAAEQAAAKKAAAEKAAAEKAAAEKAERERALALEHAADRVHGSERRAVASASHAARAAESLSRPGSAAARARAIGRAAEEKLARDQEAVAQSRSTHRPRREVKRGDGEAANGGAPARNGGPPLPPAVEGLPLLDDVDPDEKRPGSVAREREAPRPTPTPEAASVPEPKKPPPPKRPKRKVLQDELEIQEWLDDVLEKGR